MAGKQYYVTDNGRTKKYCEVSKCKYRDWKLLAERRKAVAAHNALIANPNIELTNRGLIKKPAITSPI